MSILGGDGCYAGISGDVEVDPVDFVGFQYDLNIEDQAPRRCPDTETIFDNPWIEAFEDTFLDIDRSGNGTVGDIIVFDSNEFVAGTESGLIAGECILTPSGESFCSITYEFDDGTIEATGPDRSLVITGGTGCFYGISGTISGSLTSPTTYEHTVMIDDDSTSNVECTAGVFDTAWIEQGEDFFVDFDRNNATSPGDLFVFGSHEVRVGGTGLVGLSHGKCSVLVFDGTDDDIFCSITFEFEEGTIAAQGFVTDMIITGASGCFRGLQGNVKGSDLPDPANEFGYTYTFVL